MFVPPALMGYREIVRGLKEQVQMNKKPTMACKGEGGCPVNAIVDLMREANSGTVSRTAVRAKLGQRVAASKVDELIGLARLRYNLVRTFETAQPHPLLRAVCHRSVMKALNAHSERTATELEMLLQRGGRVVIRERLEEGSARIAKLRIDLERLAGTYELHERLAVECDREVAQLEAESRLDESVVQLAAACRKVNGLDDWPTLARGRIH